MLSFFINFAFSDNKYYKLWNKMMDTNFVWCKITTLFSPWLGAAPTFDTTWFEFNFCMCDTKCFFFLHKFCILRQQILQVVKQNDGNEFCLMQNHSIVLALAWGTSHFRHHLIWIQFFACAIQNVFLFFINLCISLNEKFYTDCEVEFFLGLRENNLFKNEFEFRGFA